MSRQPTWDMAQALQGRMFEAAARDRRSRRAARLFSRAWANAAPRSFVSGGAGLAELMSRISVRGGTTQMRTRARPRARRGAPGAGRRAGVRRRRDGGGASIRCCATAGELALVGVKAFMFQEGDDPAARRAFQEIARLTGGAYERVRRRRGGAARGAAEGGGRLRGGRPDGAGGAGARATATPRAAAGTDARSVTRDAARRRVGNRFLPCRHYRRSSRPLSACCLRHPQIRAAEPGFRGGDWCASGGAVAVFVVAAFAAAARQFRPARRRSPPSRRASDCSAAGAARLAVLRRRRLRAAARPGRRRRGRRRSRCGSTRTPER